MKSLQRSRSLELAVVILALLALGIAIVGLPSVQLELTPQPPSTIRLEGVASEPVRATAGRITAADRARATERAQWKAYYYAQLRAAEATGNVQLNAATTIMAQALEGQRLEASFNGAVQAAASVPEETTVTIDDDVARARVVVEVPNPSATSLWSRLRSLEVKVKWPERATVTPPPSTVGLAGIADRHDAATSGPESPVTRAPDAHRRKVSPSRTIPERTTTPQPRPRPTARTRARPPSGATVQIPATGGFPGVVPTFYDAAGTVLGSVGQLDSEGVLAGLPLVGANDPTAAAQWAGASPRQYRGTVSAGDVFLWKSLSSADARFFEQALKTGHVVLVLGGSS